MGLDLVEKGELSEEEFSGLVKAEEGFQKVMISVCCLFSAPRRGLENLSLSRLYFKCSFVTC